MEHFVEPVKHSLQYYILAVKVGWLVFMDTSWFGVYQCIWTYTYIYICLTFSRNSHVKSKVQEVTQTCTNVENSTIQLHHTSHPNLLEWRSLPPPSSHHVGAQTPRMVGLWVASPMPHPHLSHCGRDGALHSLTPDMQRCCRLNHLEATDVVSPLLRAMLYSDHFQWQHASTDQFRLCQPIPLAVVLCQDFVLWYQ